MILGAYAAAVASREASSSGPVNVVTDTFTGSNGTELSVYGDWVDITGYSGDLIIANNRIRHSAAVSAGYRHTTAPSSADYSVSLDVTYIADAINSEGGPAGRISSSQATFYHLRVTVGGGYQLYKWVNGSATALGSLTGVSSLTLGATRTLTLDMQGDTIRGLVDGVQGISVTDTSITAAGFGGIRSFASGTHGDSTGSHYDNFSIDE